MGGRRASRGDGCCSRWTGRRRLVQREQHLDEALGLPVGARRVSPSPQVAQPPPHYRVYHCTACGAPPLDRDNNAACNVAVRAFGTQAAPNVHSIGAGDAPPSDAPLA